MRLERGSFSQHDARVQVNEGCPPFLPSTRSRCKNENIPDFLETRILRNARLGLSGSRAYAHARVRARDTFCTNDTKAISLLPPEFFESIPRADPIKLQHEIRLSAETY